MAPAAQGTTLLCTNGPTFNLTATEGYISVPDGNQIYMWGFANADTGGNFQLPGPVLCVNEGETVTVNLTNALAEPVSIVFPGQTGVTASLVGGGTLGGGTLNPPGLFTLEAAPGQTVQYTFRANHPGTYLYESGTNPFKQIQMGLYGALIVRPALGAQYVYDDPATEFDPSREYLLLLHEIDPDLHARVERGEPFDISTRHERYWTINGRSMPDLLADNGVSWLPTQPYGAMVRIEATVPGDPNARPALIRYANAGLENHPFHPHGNNMEVIGRDGRQYDESFENFTTTIGSGQTYDLFFKWEDVDAWASETNPVAVTIPGQLNLVFKGGVTFFSGDPRLGHGGANAPQDTFPPGVTSFNECGEFYYPWHSHALDEVQNFDEGFGGMFTLVRVDPPGGCP
ncbi:MAG: copper oxidase [Caldilineae bacterium]|nr:MAG: copper oxidase [Caldilineae bacterium]